MSAQAVAQAATLLLLALAWRAAAVARAQLRRTRWELLAAQAHAAQAQAAAAGLHSFLERELDRHAGEIRTFRADVQVLRETYARVLRRYQQAHRPPGSPTGSPSVH